MSPDLVSEDTSDGESERINISVDEQFVDLVDVTDLRAAVSTALLAEGYGEGEVTVVITGDEQVHALNKQYLDEDHPTDVLSFPTAEDEPADTGGAGPHFVSSPEAAAYLGDIIVACPYAQRQAAGLGRPLRDELRLLAVHGTLHLLGYDHVEPEDEASMWLRQDLILAGLPA